VVAEALRLYPTSWLNLRVAAADDVIDGITIPRGAWILICPYLTHRHPEFWARPEEFDPSRFLQGPPGQGHRFAYVPFGGGQRKCIGHHFAAVEMTLILATLLARCEVAPVDPHPIRPEPRVSLIPKGGVPLRITAVTSPNQQMVL